MEKMKTVEEITRYILEEVEEARESDAVLYYHVCREYDEDALRIEFGDVLLGEQFLRFPKYESVSRCRRKLQAKHPELRASKECQRRRYETMTKYEAYARSEVR